MAENFLQGLADTDTQIAQLRSLSEDSEIGRLGGVPPAERVFIYLQVSCNLSASRHCVSSSTESHHTHGVMCGV